MLARSLFALGVFSKCTALMEWKNYHAVCTVSAQVFELSPGLYKNNYTEQYPFYLYYKYDCFYPFHKIIFYILFVKVYLLVLIITHNLCFSIETMAMCETMSWSKRSTCMSKTLHCLYICLRISHSLQNGVN